MNRIYRSIWNASTGTFVAAAENVRSRTGSGSVLAGIAPVSRSGSMQGLSRVGMKILAASLLMAFGTVFGTNVYALPTGGVVAAGSAGIATSGSTTTVTQSSGSAVVNWQGFSIGQTEAVRFVQPNASSVVLNRVLGPDPSSILGSLSANGKVFIVNPNGILFGVGAQVNVGALVASTLNINDADFMSSRFKFSGVGGSVVNQGTINANGGYVALLGANVSNEGVIVANLGSVALAAGTAMTLDVAGDGLLNVAVDQGAVNALVQNRGLIHADGGQVVLTAQAAGNLLQSVVNNTGVIQAQSLVNRNGVISLLGDMQSGTVNIGGTLDVSGSGAGQTGGKVVATAHHVGLFGANINASGDAGGGTVLIGGDLHGTNPAVPNAFATYMSTDSSITADAVTNGNGGTVVLWSDDSTRAYGSISARGGAQGGNGGMIETSGHYLDVAGINISAASLYGDAGQWLLDPADVTIGAGTVGATFSAGTWTPNSGVNAATIDAAGLQATLNGGTDVTITTTNSGAPGIGAGDITVAAALTWTTGKSLTLNAAHDVIVNVGSAITASTAGSGIIMTAGNDINLKDALVASALGSRIVLTAGNDILTTGAAAITASAASTQVTLNASRDVTLATAVTATGNGAKIDIISGRNASLFTTTAAGGGAVSARANNDVTVTGHIVSTAAGVTGGTVLLRADDDGSGPGVIGGTVKFTGVGDVSAAATTVRFNPAGYANTTTEIAAYVVKVIAGTRDIQAWVFAQGVNKVYDGNNIDTLVFKNPIADNPNVGNVVTLNGGTATFNTKDVGNAKTVSFNGYTLGGADLAKFNLFSAFGVASGTGTTTANVTPAPLTIQANDFTKYFGEVPVLPTTAFTLPVAPVAGETVGGVTETSPGTVAIASVGGSPYTITPSSATGGTFNPSNYTITYRTGLLTVLPIVPTVAVVVPPGSTPPGSTPTDTTSPGETNSTDSTPLIVAGLDSVPGDLAGLNLALGGGGVGVPLNRLTGFPVTPPVAVAPVVEPPAQVVIAPVPVAPVAAPVEQPRLYVAPVRPRKQDRN